MNAKILISASFIPLVMACIGLFIGIDIGSYVMAAFILSSMGLAVLLKEKN